MEIGDIVYYTNCFGSRFECVIIALNQKPNGELDAYINIEDKILRVPAGELLSKEKGERSNEKI